MINTTVTSNIRMPEYLWLQIRAIAAEQGISVNKYLVRITEEVTQKRELGGVKKTSKKTIWDLPELAGKYGYENKGLSKDDEAIYG